MVVMFVLIVYQHLTQRVSNAGIMIWAPKLCAQINEKYSSEKPSLSQMLGAKIFITIGSKHCKKFSVAIPSCIFYKKAVTIV